jgi:hypothetical protein
MHEGYAEREDDRDREREWTEPSGKPLPEAERLSCPVHAVGAGAIRTFSIIGRCRRAGQR